MFNTKNIKDFRLKTNMSQDHISILLKVSRSSYAMWESNNNIFPIKRLIELSEIFNISLDFFMGLINDPKTIDNKFELSKSKDRIKEFRKDNRLTQERLAQILNTNKSVICNYEKGRNLIATPFLYTICTKYKISADYLLGRIDYPKYLK